VDKSYQQQYAEILRKLVYTPQKVSTSRVGDVRSNFVETMRVDMTKEFPLMDVKHVSFKNVLHELLWFIRGATNIRYLVENGCNIWNDDAYRYYVDKYAKFERYYVDKHEKNKMPVSKEEFLSRVKNSDLIRIPLLGGGAKIYYYGSLDKVYGYQWRSFNGGVDQLANVIDTLVNNPSDRRMIVTAHNPDDLKRGDVALPSCHNYMQFYTIPMTATQRERYGEVLGYEPEYFVSLYFNIRSNDFFLGQPYNMPSYALLLMMIGKVTGYVPLELVCNAVDCHLYDAHMDAAQQWLDRYAEKYSDREEFSYSTANVKINNKSNIDEFVFDDFELKNYKPESKIKAPLLT
jgi:thymidylate synthase